MLRDVKFWTEWEAQGPLSEPADFHRNLRLVEAMYQLARTLGAFPPPDPLQGIETDIRRSRILSASIRGASGTDRSGS